MCGTASLNFFTVTFLSSIVQRVPLHKVADDQMWFEPLQSEWGFFICLWKQLGAGLTPSGVHLTWMINWFCFAASNTCVGKLHYRASAVWGEPNNMAGSANWVEASTMVIPFFYIFGAPIDINNFKSSIVCSFYKVPPGIWKSIKGKI